MRKFLAEFQEFASKGNVLDMAVGVIIGAAFGKIVTSFVSDILTPPLGLLLGRVDFSDLYINLSGGEYASLAEAKAAGAATLNYGLFLNQVIDFVIVAFAIFFMIKQINRLKNFRKKEETDAAPATKTCPRCATDIPVKASRCPHCTSELEER